MCDSLKEIVQKLDSGFLFGNLLETNQAQLVGKKCFTIYEITIIKGPSLNFASNNKQI